jgi:hypothetical protein
MKFYTFIFFVLICDLSSNAQSINNALLTGTWESVNTVNQKRTQISFGSDNNFVLKYLLVADYHYEVHKNLLISYLQRDDTTKKPIIDTSFLIIKPDTIIRSYNRLGWKDTVTMVRVAYPDKKTKDKNPLLGTWKWTYPAGDTAVSSFFDDGNWHFSVPLNTYFGTYSVNGDTLKTIFNFNSEEQKKTFWIEGDLLALQDIISGKQYLYRRVH